MTKKNLFLAFLTAILVFPLLAHGQTKHRPDKDDDDDDRPVFRPPALRPGEKPLDADFTCPYVKGFEHPERFNGYTLRLNRGTKTPTDRCRAVVTSTAGKRLIAARDWALKVDKISGTDINGDDDDSVLEYAWLNSYHQSGLKNLLDVAVIKFAAQQAPQPYRKIDELPFDSSVSETTRIVYGNFSCSGIMRRRARSARAP